MATNLKDDATSTLVRPEYATSAGADMNTSGQSPSFSMMMRDLVLALAVLLSVGSLVYTFVRTKTDSSVLNEITDFINISGYDNQTKYTLPVNIIFNAGNFGNVQITKTGEITSAIDSLTFIKPVVIDTSTSTLSVHEIRRSSNEQQQKQLQFDHQRPPPLRSARSLGDVMRREHDLRERERIEMRTMLHENRKRVEELTALIQQHLPSFATTTTTNSTVSSVSSTKSKSTAASRRKAAENENLPPPITLNSLSMNPSPSTGRSVNLPKLTEHAAETARTISSETSNRTVVGPRALPPDDPALTVNNLVIGKEGTIRLSNGEPLRVEDLIVSGNAALVDVDILSSTAPFVAIGNSLTDAEIGNEAGFFVKYLNTESEVRYGAMFRDSTTNRWRILDNLSTEPVDSIPTNEGTLADIDIASIQVVSGIFIDDPYVQSGVNVTWDPLTKTLAIAPSSERFKEDVRDLHISPEDSARIIDGLRQKLWRYRGVERTVPGWSAEQVFGIYPEAVTMDDQGKPYAVNHEMLLPVMIAELQYLRKRVSALENQTQ